MRFAIGLVGLCACNQIFGVNTSQVAPVTDAQYFDAPVDAPFQCPPLGQAPHFSPVIHQPIIQDCSGYMVSPDRDWATAACESQISQGVIDGPLTPITSLDSTFSQPSLAPEGNELFVLHHTALMAKASLLDFTRNPDDSWTQAYAVTTDLDLSISAEIGSVSRGPTRRMLVIAAFTDPVVNEIAIDGSGTATDVGMISSTDLQIDGITTPPNVSPDGLRIVFSAAVSATPGVFYSDRPDLSSPFRPAVILAPLQNVYDAYMTEDCSRLYFSAVGSILYLQQGD